MYNSVHIAQNEGNTDLEETVSLPVSSLVRKDKHVEQFNELLMHYDKRTTLRRHKGENLLGPLEIDS